MSAQHDITQLLVDWANGNREALEKLAPLVEGELHRLARSQMYRERPDHLLQTTALVNEAFIGLIDQSRMDWRSRAHFFAFAATVMRHILLNYARARDSQKRGGDFVHEDLDKAAAVASQKSAELIALDEALTALAAYDPRKSQVVELRYFGGLTVKETAAALGVSTSTVEEDWSFAKSWLLHELRYDA